MIDVLSTPPPGYDDTQFGAIVLLLVLVWFFTVFSLFNYAAFQHDRIWAFVLAGFILATPYEVFVSALVALAFGGAWLAGLVTFVILFSLTVRWAHKELVKARLPGVRLTERGPDGKSRFCALRPEDFSVEDHFKQK